MINKNKTAHLPPPLSPTGVSTTVVEDSPPQGGARLKAYTTHQNKCLNTSCDGEHTHTRAHKNVLFLRHEDNACEFPLPILDRCSVCSLFSQSTKESICVHPVNFLTKKNKKKFSSVLLANLRNLYFSQYHKWTPYTSDTPSSTPCNQYTIRCTR